MKFDLSSKTLYDDGGNLLKVFSCPERVSWRSMKLSRDGAGRDCDRCERVVIDSAGLSDIAVRELLGEDPNVCLKVSPTKKPFESKRGGVMANQGDLKPSGSRTITTARTVEDINRGALEGFRPLVEPVEPNEDIHQKYRVVQNRETREIRVDGDYRTSVDPDDWEIVIDWTYVYPRELRFESPFAAYLLPADLEVGEIVWLEDLIEDIPSISWNQGDGCRVEAAAAMWTSESGFVIIPDETWDQPEFVG